MKDEFKNVDSEKELQEKISKMDKLLKDNEKLKKLLDDKNKNTQKLNNIPNNPAMPTMVNNPTLTAQAQIPNNQIQAQRPIIQYAYPNNIQVPKQNNQVILAQAPRAQPVTQYYTPQQNMMGNYQSQQVAQPQQQRVYLIQQGNNGMPVMARQPQTGQQIIMVAPAM